MRSIYTFVIGISLIVSLTGCENCGPSSEPLLYLSLSDTVSTALDTLYAFNSKGPLPAQPYTNNGLLRTGSQIVLPVNLNADSTRYAFKRLGRLDTVTVYYRRDFFLQSRKCGYVINLYEPRTGTHAKTSRGKVQSVSYLQNRNSTILSGPSNTGIYLQIRL